MSQLDRYQQEIRRFRDKVALSTATWADILREAHETAFVVAGATGADLLNDLRSTVAEALEEGRSLQWFRKNFDLIVAKHGWQHTGSRDWRSRVIYETNMRNVYASARYKQLTSAPMRKTRPYWQYLHSHAVPNPREQHLAWHGMILHGDDPWWKTHYPPGGWGCRCRVRALSERDMARMGKLEPDKAPPIVMQNHTLPNGRSVQTPQGIDPGFDYIPGDSVSIAEQSKRWAANKADVIDAVIGQWLLYLIEGDPNDPNKV